MKVQPAPFAKSRWRAFHCCAVIFAHKRALPQTIICLSNLCEHNLPDKFGLAELIKKYY